MSSIVRPHKGCKAILIDGGKTFHCEDCGGEGGLAWPSTSASLCPTEPTPSPRAAVLADFSRLLRELLEGDRDELYDALMEQLSMDDLDELQARLP